jgi:hypothetical protein
MSNKKILNRLKFESACVSGWSPKSFGIVRFPFAMNLISKTFSVAECLQGLIIFLGGTVRSDSWIITEDVLTPLERFRVTERPVL